MAEKPILFNDAMVRAILDGRKTQTRRPVKPGEQRRNGPFGAPGDLLWAREAFNVGRPLRNIEGVIDDEMLWPGPLPKVDPRGKRLLDDWCVGYRADGGDGPWRPSIHMPRWAARIWLRVTGVRVERVQDITEEDAQAEGVEPWVSTDYEESYRYGFSDVWSSIYGDESWERSDWVWVCEFERAEAPR